MTEPTICAECKHFKPRFGERRSEWYDHFCEAMPREEAFDYTTGKTIFQEYPYCRDINPDGNCKLYEKKKRGLFG